MSLETALTILCFVIACVGLAHRLLPSEPSKRSILIGAIALIVLLTAVELFSIFRHKSHVEAAADRIVSLLETKDQTAFELFSAFRKTNHDVFDEALNDSIERGVVTFHPLTLSDNAGRRYTFLVYALAN